MGRRSRRAPGSRTWDVPLAVACVIASAVIVVWAIDADDEARPRPAVAPAARTTAAQPPPRCRAVQERTGKEPLGTCRSESGTLLTIGVQERPLRLGPLALRVLDVSLLRATSPAGVARRRARVTVRLRLANAGERTVDVGWSLLDLSVRGITVEPDRSSARLPGGWRPATVAPGESRTGDLRFETAGGVTERIVRTRRADLAIRLDEDRLGVIRLDLRPAP